MYQNIFTPCKSFKENTEQLNINFLRMLNRYKLYISEEITKMLTLQKKKLKQNLLQMNKQLHNLGAQLKRQFSHNLQCTRAIFQRLFQVLTVYHQCCLCLYVTVYLQ